MKTNKAKRAAKAAKRPVMTATRKTALAGIPHAVVNVGSSETVLAEMVRNAGGNQPYVQREAVAGRIAYGLIRKGDNRPEAELVAIGYGIIDKPGKDSKGNAKRRTQAEHDVWNSAKVWFSGFLKRNGIVSSGKNAGNSNGAGNKGKRKAPAPTPPTHKELRDAAPKMKTREDTTSFVMQQAAMLLTFSNKNTRNMVPQITSAIQDFHERVKELNATVNGSHMLVKRQRRSGQTQAPIVPTVTE